MAFAEPDDEFEEPGFRDPLPLDDRLWRHPSELPDVAPEHRSALGRLRSFFSRPRP